LDGDVSVAPTLGAGSEFALTIGTIFRYGARTFADSQVTDYAPGPELELRGPRITAAYYAAECCKVRRRLGLHTGQMAANGFLQITGRAEDMIKSGGARVSCDLENHIRAHPE
jgi:acyl-CoA synthetase (AMP-forming)/AMP-acid ligase II